MYSWKRDIENEQTSTDYSRLRRKNPERRGPGTVEAVSVRARCKDFSLALIPASPHASRKDPFFIDGAFHCTIMLPIIRSAGIDCDSVCLSVLCHWQWHISVGRKFVQANVGAELVEAVSGLDWTMCYYCSQVRDGREGARLGKVSS